MKSKKIIKSSIKSLFICLMLVIIALTFSACAQVRLMTITNDDGTIDEIVTITIDTEEVVSAGHSVAELKDDIMIKSQAQAQAMKEDLDEKILNDLLMVRDEETTLVLNSFINGISVVKSDWIGDTYSIGIRFKNIDVYRYYYNIKENINVQMQTEEHFFYDKVFYYSNTMYVKHHDLYNKVSAYYSAKYPNLINSEGNELLYTYKTDLRRQHSDADYITKQDGEYYHTWVVDANNLEKPIMLYYNIANPENYIIVSVISVFVLTIILSGVAFVTNLINKKKGNKI